MAQPSYQESDFEGALSSYLRVVEAGLESGEVYYNIGNAYFKVGDLARAILYYERARRMTASFRATAMTARR